MSIDDKHYETTRLALDAELKRSEALNNKLKAVDANHRAEQKAILAQHSEEINILDARIRSLEIKLRAETARANRLEWLAADQKATAKHTWDKDSWASKQNEVV